MATIEFLTRTTCPLCDEARRRLDRWAALLRVEVDERIIEDDPDLETRFGARVPVLRSRTGRVLAEGRISPLSVARAVLTVRLTDTLAL